MKSKKMQLFDVITFGSAILDIFVQSPEAKLIKNPAVTAEKVLAFPYGTKCEVERLVVASGGGGTNTAVGFARLGLKTAVAARCGWDLAGKLIRQEIKKEGVDDSFLVQEEGEKTDYSVILIGPDGGRTILVFRGPTRLEKNLIDFRKLKAKWLYCSSLEGNLDLLASLANHAKQNKIKIASNPGRREIQQKKKLLKIAQKLDVLIVNQDEAAQLLGLSAAHKDLFAKMKKAFPKTTVVMTGGAKGAHVSLPTKEELFIEGLKVKMADSTGAGDGFASGLITGLVKGWKIEKALQLAVANGASAVTQIGSKTGLIKEKEIDLWLEKPRKIKRRK